MGQTPFPLLLAHLPYSTPVAYSSRRQFLHQVSSHQPCVSYPIFVVTQNLTNDEPKDIADTSYPTVAVLITPLATCASLGALVTERGGSTGPYTVTPAQQEASNTANDRAGRGASAL